jgi:hypothetical protein
MELKEAVEVAKAHVQSVFADDLVGEPQLEEVWFDNTKNDWHVTLGFYRKPDMMMKAAGSFARYVYKSVSVDGASKQATGIRNRVTAVAE